LIFQTTLQRDKPVMMKLGSTTLTRFAQKTSVIIGLFSLAGCNTTATTQNYEAILATYVGASESQLIEALGPPDQVYISGSSKYLTYIRSSDTYVPGTSPTYQTQIIGNTAYTTGYGGLPAAIVNHNCKTTFTIRNSSIVDWRWEGNNCIAEKPEAAEPMEETDQQLVEKARTAINNLQLNKAFAFAVNIRDSNTRDWILSAIAETHATEGNMGKANQVVSNIRDSSIREHTAETMLILNRSIR